MHLRIRHVTRYEYSRPVFCEPMTLRMKPRDDPYQRLLEHRLVIDPQPAGMCDGLDVAGHTATFVWFDGLISSLTITVEAAVETLCMNPFAFLLDPAAATLPLRYTEEAHLALAPYAVVTGNAAPVAELAQQIAEEARRETLPFLTNLTRRIPELCSTVYREQGDPWPPETTLARREGSCRDLAVLFIAACRTQGLAARFVSGYHARPDVDREFHMHAWGEVYLPGAGWRGFDPSTGMAVADRHVALAAGLSPLLAAPTAGAYRGTGVTSRLTTRVDVEDVQQQDSGRDADLCAPSN